MSRISRILSHAALAGIAFAAASHGQISTLKNLAAGDSAPTASPANDRDRLERWQKEARESLAKLESAAPGTQVPSDITPAEIEDRRRDLSELIITVTRSFKSLDSIADANKSLEVAKAEAAAWTGFKEAPPYSILQLDELLNERDAIKRQLASHQAALANFQRLLAGTMEETKTSEEAASAQMLAVQQADEASLAAATWRLEAAKDNSRLLAARAGLIESNCESLTDRVAAAQADLQLIDSKVKALGANARFSDEDMAMLKKLSDERKSSYRKQTKPLDPRLKNAITARSKAKSELDSLAAEHPETPDPKQAEALALARLRLEIADGRVDILQNIIDAFNSLAELEDFNLSVYEDRRAYLQAGSPAERKTALTSLTVALERIRAWENVVDNEIDSTSADLSKVESRTASITVENPRFGLLNEQRGLMSEKLAAFQNVAKAVVSQRKLIKRWVLEYTPKPDAKPGFGARLSTLASNAGAGFMKFWNFTVISFEDKIEIDGKTMVGKIPVTIGMLLRAILFFTIGYWVSSRVANHIQGRLVTHGHIQAAQARTIRNWTMIVVGLFLVLGTLAFLKIPLTVFAFFGGALAIGIGFGTQTLIKNFISGIILLLERKIRVGDILDVDGIVGTVTEINTRSSVIQSPDEVETMVPNSLFLENRVTNWTLTSPRIRCMLRLGVAYGTPPPKIIEVLTEAAGRHGLVLKDPAPFAIFEDFGDSSLMFCLYYWVQLGDNTNRIIIASDLRIMIEKRLGELGISIPFPQRDVQLATSKPLQVEWSAVNPPPDPPEK